MHPAYQNQLASKAGEVLHALVAGFVLSLFLFRDYRTVILGLSLPKGKERPQQGNERNHRSPPHQPHPKILRTDNPTQLPDLPTNHFHFNLLPHNLPDHPIVLIFPSHMISLPFLSIPNESITLS